MLSTLAMIGPGATPPSDNSDQNPLRVALAFGDKLLAHSKDALEHLLLAQNRALVSESVVSHVQAMIASLAHNLADTGHSDRGWALNLEAQLTREAGIRNHCHALALEWRLTKHLEAAMGIDPVLTPALQEGISNQNAAIAGHAMRALGAQARFVQAQGRMELSPSELPAELFHLALVITRDCAPAHETDSIRDREARLRSLYNEGSSRIALQAQLASQWSEAAADILNLHYAGVGLWLAALSARSGESREQISFATVEPLLGHLLLTLRAAGASPAEAEAQVLIIADEASLPRGLADVGTREAAQWLAQSRRGSLQ